MSTPIPTWLLERFALGELPPERMEAVRRALAAEPDGEARLAALRDSDRDILATYAPSTVAAAVRERSAASPRPANNNRMWLLAVPVLAVAASIAVLVNTGGVLLHGDVPKGAPADTSSEVTRPKGLSPQLVVQRKRDGDPERLRDGDLARAGDVLQLRYVAAGDAYGAIVSVDGRDDATVHLADGGHAARLQGDGAVALPSAFELDDAPGFERFFLVSGPKPFDVAPVVDAAEALAAGPHATDASLELPGLHVTSFTVRKP